MSTAFLLLTDNANIHVYGMWNQPPVTSLRDVVIGTCPCQPILVIIVLYTYTYNRMYIYHYFLNRIDGIYIYLYIYIMCYNRRLRGSGNIHYGL